MSRHRRHRDHGRPIGIGKLPSGLEDVLEHAQAVGWRLERRPGGHLMAFAPDGVGIVTIGNGDGNGRTSSRKAIADLRRNGLDWPPKGRS